MTRFPPSPDLRARIHAAAIVFNQSAEHRAVVASMAEDVRPFRPLAEQIRSAVRRYFRPMPRRVRNFINAPMAALIADTPIAVATVVFENDDRFTFAGPETDPTQASEVVVGVCRDEAGDECDIFAWSVRSGVIASYTGRAGVNDESEALRPRAEEALAIHPDPGAWLRAGRRGIFLIDIARAAPVLRDAAPLLVPTEHFAAALRNGLSIPPPRIFVAGRKIARAA